MRILMVHPHDICSPAEPWTRRIRSFAGELAKRGHEIKLVYFPLCKGSLKTHSLEGYEAIPLSRYPSAPGFIRNTLRITRLAGWADLVHFQKCHHYASIPSVIAAYLAKKPLHYDWDDWEEMIWYESCGRKLHSRLIGSSFKALERLLPVLADTVSVSGRELKRLAIRFGAKEKDICTVPVGADLEEFNPHIDGKQIKERYGIKGGLVLYIGQLHGAQYLDLFIRAANLILHRDPGVTFMVVGEGFMERHLNNLALELGIQDRIIFTGSVPHNDIPRYICAADICVAPFRDTKVTRCKSPLKIAEYMACGKAIVAANVGEVRKMLGGVGVLVEPGDVDALAEGILTLLSDKSLRESLGRFARQRAERSYSWSNSVSSLLTAYESVYAK